MMHKSYKRNRITKAKANSETADVGVEFRKTTLDNGIRILTEEVPGVESYALGICIDAGSRQDPPEYKGLAHFVEHALFLGTKKRSAKKISMDFETEGAYTNAFTTKEFTCYYVRALKSHFKKTFGILADLIINPLFDESKVSKEKDVIIEEIKSYEDEPEEFIFDIGERVIYGGHSLAHPIAGYVETVENIRSAQLTEFHKKYYHPGNIIISAAGNLKHEELVKETEKLFGNIKSTETENKLIKPEIVPAISEIYNKSYQQAHLLMCRQSPGLDSDDRYPLAALNVILGDGLSSRLHIKLREDNALAYNVYSGIQMMADTGIFHIYAGVDSTKADKAKKLIDKELHKLINGKINNTEIRRAKEQIKSNTIMALESMYTRMTSMAKSEITLGKYEDIPSTLQAIEDIEYEDVKKAAEKYLNPDDWSIVYILPE